MFIVGAVSFINSCVAFVTSVMDLGGIVNDVVVFIVRLIAMIGMLCLLNNIRAEVFISELMTVTKNIKIILLFFVWELVCLNILQNTVLSMNFGIKLNLALGSAIFITAVVSCVVIHLLISNNLRSSYYKKINATMEEKVH